MPALLGVRISRRPTSTRQQVRLLGGERGFVTLLSRIRGLQARSHYKGITGRYKAITSRYGVITESLRTVAQPLRVISHCGAGWLQRACALQRHWLRSQPSSEGLAPWVVPSAPLPQGDSLWLAHSANMYAAGSEKEKRAGGPTSWGYHSTIVLILQVGRWQGLRERRGGLWRRTPLSPCTSRPSSSLHPSLGDG